MRSRRNVLLLVLSLVALVSLTGAPSAFATGGPYSMTISTNATSGMYCNAYECYPTANGANLYISDLLAHMSTASTDGYSNFQIGDSGSGETGTITIETSIIAPSMMLTLNPDSGSVVIDDTTDSGDTAIIDTEGLNIYSAISGPATGSSSLDVRGGELALYGGTTGSTLGSLDFEDGAQFPASNNTLSADSITVTGDLGGDGDGSNTVTFDSTDGTTLNPGSYGYAGIDSLTVEGPAAIEGTFNGDGNDEDEIFEGAVTLNGDTSIGGHATFDSTIDSGASSENLLVNGSARFDEPVGSVAQLESLDVTGATTIDTTAVSTITTQSYGATTLDASPTLSGSTITFTSTVDGAQTLTIDDAVVAFFDGAVGGSIPLAELDLEPGATYPAELSGNVTTAGLQDYSQPVTFEAAVTLSGGTIDLAHAVTDSQTLTVGDGTLDLNDADDAFTGVEVESSATVDFVSGALATATVTLDGGTLFWDSGNTSLPNAIDVNSGGTVDVGTNNITLSSGTGGSNGGPLFKAGSGDLTLAAGSRASYGNLVQVSSGPLTVTGSIITPVSVGSGATLVCDGGTLGGAVTNSGGTLTGAPSAPTAVTATDESGDAAIVDFTPGANNCFPVSYTADQLGSAISESGTSPQFFFGLTIGQSYDFTVTETNPLGSATSSSATVYLAQGPTVSITTPAQNASYTQGQVVDAAYTCAEASGGPGLDSCSGTVADGAPIDTSTTGVHMLGVSATSEDGFIYRLGATYTVTAPPSPPTTTTPQPTTPPATPTPAPPSSAFSVKALTAAASGALRLTLTLPGAGTVKATETLAGAGTVSASAHASAAGTCKLTTALSRKLQTLLKRKHVRRATVKITFTPTGGSARTVSKTVTL